MPPTEAVPPLRHLLRVSGLKVSGCRQRAQGLAVASTLRIPGLCARGGEGLTLPSLQRILCHVASESRKVHRVVLGTQLVSWATFGVPQVDGDIAANPRWLLTRLTLPVVITRVGSV